MKKFLAFLLIFAITFAVPSAGARPFANTLSPQDEGNRDRPGYDTYFSADQLENLVAPIALYPDPLLAQVLLAATFPDQIDEAARTVRAYGAGYAIDSAPWDVSVKAVAHYPTVLSMMADKIDWTTSLGQAYVNQSSDLMDAVQRLRRQARSGGYLVNSPQQEIVDTDGYLYIYPAQPEYIYVPYYDPAIIFAVVSGLLCRALPSGSARGFSLAHGSIMIATGVIIASFITAGEAAARFGSRRSRSHIHINNIYVNNSVSQRDAKPSRSGSAR